MLFLVLYGHEELFAPSLQQLLAYLKNMIRKSLAYTRATPVLSLYVTLSGLTVILLVLLWGLCFAHSFPDVRVPG